MNKLKFFKLLTHMVIYINIINIYILQFIQILKYMIYKLIFVMLKITQ